VTLMASAQVVNVLDEFHNPGLRDAIKMYSTWPTIPQLYVQGEFVGGSDICEQLAATGELQELLRSA
jgi:glutaredoxin-related protein